VGWGYAWASTNASQTARDRLQEFAEELPDIQNGVPRFVPCNGAAASSAPATVHAQDRSDLQFTFGFQAQRLSCMAQSNAIYLAANVATVVPCSVASDPNCPADGRYQFNTEVVYGPSGELLAKYFKSHLFGESDALNEPVTPDPVFFDAYDIGVRFGLMICYDIQFHQPMDSYVKWGITDVLYSSNWVNTPPGEMAVEIQAARAAYSNINLIASNSGYGAMVCGLEA